MTTSYCYLPDDFVGHRPANRELVERVGRGAVYSWPSTTTMHMDLMRRTRTTLNDAHNDGVLDAAVPAVKSQPDLANPEITEPIHHRSGCPHSRTGKCLCTYLAQWDTERTPAEESLLSQIGEGRLAAFTAQEEAAGRVITIDTLNGRTSEWDGVFQNPEPVRLQLPVVIATTAEDPAVIAEKIVKDNPQWFGELPAGTYQKREDDTASQALADEKLRSKYWHGEHTDLNRRFTGVLVLGLAGWALAVARGIWGF